ncbi:cytochrome P450 [Actibacterium ureilyticum]|uniref:cytochrome P450 n=1 Tax=Actibacterium ureilyticum TaxID=1590614 RepID=UPI00159558FF|nr:cytochrome P450 [Actibacterium ureilyticum]
MTLPIGPDGLPLLSAEELATAPLAALDDARRQTPVLRTDPARVMVLRAAAVQRLSTDPGLLQLPGAQYATAMGIPPGRCRAFLESFMLMTNGADHQHLRGAFARTFAHPVVKSKRALVREVADAIMADLPRGVAFDFLATGAARLPAEVIATVLGLPVDQSAWFAGQVYSLSRSLMVPYAIDQHDEIDAAAGALFAFVADALDRRRADPRDDFLSMLATDESARALPPEVLIYQVMGIILAGSDTTRSALNMTVGRLLQDRPLWDDVLADRSLIPAAIDEALRIEPPVGSLPRFAPAAIKVDGHKVGAGQVVALSTLSAMRDEGRVANPKRFDLHRKDRARPHLVFGGGAHRCLGEMLARIELEEGLAALMDAAPDIELIEAPRMLGVSGIRRSTPMIVRIPARAETRRSCF